ncbi:HAD-IIIA family hydrolase [uncultured Sneathiella sp.]|jgi:D-glycero-D-manno-heptose 1,7-bisphosphate phosphatase|uniref:D-glycero-alpha-D-manno-heptose-1,7-bisphosphate 7-phosphatase n=1 Tax=uncultured Sneathiella sp. TaxID=879315 RepID=UPI0030DB5850|tara:strand:+ start:38060 stop:38605 length:546 start_codon:yes stop_codon:yes gene_type:complete
MLVLLDRDGVINEDRADFVKSPAELIFIPKALEAIARLNGHGHKLAVVTNQSCIGRGIINEDQLDSIHGKLRDALAKVAGRLDDIIIAPDAPWAATERRKPGPGMLIEAMRKFNMLPAETVLIGDSERDIEAAKSASCHRILVQTGKGRKTLADGLKRHLMPVHIAADLDEAANFILEGRF